MDHFLLQVFIAALITDLATGLGAVPFFFVKEIPRAWNGFSWGLAGGLMFAASVIDLILPGVTNSTVPRVVVGGVVGLLFFLAGRAFVRSFDFEFEDIKDTDSVAQVLLILGVMTVHSFPEGFAIGLAFISGIETLGILLSVVIAVHNIPEGLAISIPLKQQGISAWKCVWYSILSSVPQPIAAVLVVLFTDVLRTYLGVGFGFAAGAMLALVFLELVPEGLAYGQKYSFAFGMGVGIAGMYLVNVLVSFPGF